MEDGEMWCRTCEVSEEFADRKRVLSRGHATHATLAAY